MNKELAYTQNYSEGEKYQDNKNLSTKDIAKLVRQEINKKYKKADGYKISVRCDYFAGGSAINVIVYKVPFAPYHYEYANYVISNGYSYRNDRQLPLYNEKMRAFIDELDRIVDQYNYSDCDGMIDYFNVNYYSNVSTSFSWDCDKSTKEYDNYLIDLSAGEYNSENLKKELAI